MRQFFNPHAHCFRMVTADHIDHLYLLTKRLDFSRRDITEYRTLAWRADDSSGVVYAMFCKCKQRCAWKMSLWVNASDDKT